MVSGLMIATAYIAACSPTLTFCIGKCIAKSSYKMGKHISDGLMKKEWSLLSQNNNTTKIH